MVKELFGKLGDGREVYEYSLDNGSGLRASFIEYGAIIRKIEVKNSAGEYVDVVLGYEDLESYVGDTSFFGCMVGRNANRIKDGRFVIDGTEYQLEKNENGNNLHSGLDFFNKRVWEGSCEENKVTFSLHSPEGDQGFPGAMDVKVSYELTAANAIRLTIEAVSDRDTVCNMVNHSYFNLNGHDSGSIVKHTMEIKADHYLPIDSTSIPTGEIAPVDGTPFDFRTPKAVGSDLDSDHGQVRLVGGYDHTFCVGGTGLRPMAKVVGDISGICLSINSDLPGVQFYAGVQLGAPGAAPGKNNCMYAPFGGLAMETQFYPNSVNEPGFASPVLKADEKFTTVTEFVFS